jgi:hypothetical protein
MYDLTFQLHGEDLVTLDDMGEGQIVLSSYNDTGGREAIALTWDQLSQAVEALRPRYGSEAKNIDRERELEIDGVDAILASLG